MWHTLAWSRLSSRLLCFARMKTSCSGHASTRTKEGCQLSYTVSQDHLVFDNYQQTQRQSRHPTYLSQRSKRNLQESRCTAGGRQTSSIATNRDEKCTRQSMGSTSPHQPINTLTTTDTRILHVAVLAKPIPAPARHGWHVPARLRSGRTCASHRI